MSSVLAGLRRFGSDSTDGQLTLMLWSEEAHYCRTKGGWHARRPSCHPVRAAAHGPHGWPPSRTIDRVRNPYIWGSFPQQEGEGPREETSQGTIERSLAPCAPRTQKRLVHAAACGASASQHDS